MHERIDYTTTAAGAFTALVGLERHIASAGLDPILADLVRTRVSQINGCAYCVDRHTKDARANGETEQRLFLLAAWREARCYTDRERAALAWAEVLTLLSGNDVSDGLYEATRKHFDEAELVNLTAVIVVTNSWNRFAVAFRTPAGTYQTPKHTPSTSAKSA